MDTLSNAVDSVKQACTPNASDHADKRQPVPLMPQIMLKLPRPTPKPETLAPQ
eukprot:Awhi_evm1s8239